ncbi:DUF2938 domain-containing protein [Luteimonas gilva]|uniref:DUF2938 domain-containing protein n=1 Tax=Luteimonas gilva TaxID=2572684 RepID=A0A4U5JPC5_9GAMM|nr:DUF2938 domain-containing protein [Luteimonas gilva]TKR30666.1 DUF2938 domain-containing protein [Luteimonas gilva]
MSFAPNLLLAGLLIGIGATLTMDLWALLLKRAFRIPSLSYCLVGRWLGHMPAGTFKHTNIGAAPPKPRECAVGWVAHYLIGAIFAVALLALAPAEWSQRPTLWPALVFGIATVAVPFLIMQPSFGFGIAASKTPNPRQARLKSLATHAVFGVGLYASALALSRLW